MNPLHPSLQRLFCQACAPISPPASDLEERILSDWREARPSLSPSHQLRDLRIALAAAAAALVFTCILALPTLGDRDISSVILTNFAVQDSLTHDHF